MLQLKVTKQLAKAILGSVLISVVLSSVLSSGAFAASLPNSKLHATVNALNADYSTAHTDGETKEVIQWYTRFGSGVLNWYLRDQSESNAETIKDICKLDSVFAKNSIRKAKSLTLYRGHDYLPKGSDRVGYRFTDNAYTSTSLALEVAMKFATKDEATTHVLDIIKVDTEVIPALWVNIFSAWDEQEYEVLLHRGVQFEVVDVKKENEGTPLTVRTLRALKIQRDSKIENTLNCH